MSVFARELLKGFPLLPARDGRSGGDRRLIIDGGSLRGGGGGAGTVSGGIRTSFATFDSMRLLRSMS